MTPLSTEVARAQIAEAHRQANELRAGRRVSAERRRARRDRKVAERQATTARLRMLAPDRRLALNPARPKQHVTHRTRRTS